MKKNKKNMPAWAQKDLKYFPAIYVSTGSNLNDDVFLPEEVKIALHTIAYKPINNNHMPEEIIGHMFDASVIEKEETEGAAKQSTVVQTVLISKNKASSLEEAKKLVPESFSSSSVEETDQYFRFRQRDPSTFKKGSFRTKKISEGVIIVVGKPKGPTSVAYVDFYDYSLYNGGRDQYYGGNTDAADDNNHSHSWTIVYDASGNLLEAYTSWDDGHRHSISPGAIKQEKTCPGGSSMHTHNLLELPQEVKDDIVIAGIDEVDNDSLLEELDDFDVLSEGVLYASVYPDMVKDILEQAKSNKKFVSMETWFSGFDYLVGEDVIKRNSETQFLDQYLRAKGGSGDFNGKSVKRVLRNLHFGGEGVVEIPANPVSVILAKNQLPNQLNEQETNDAMNKINKNRVINNDTDSSKAFTKNGENEMDQVEELKKQLAEANKKIEELQKSEAAKEVTSLKETVAELTTTISVKENELIETNKKLAEKEIALTKANDNLEKVDKELSQIKLAQVVAKIKNDFASFDITEADLNDITEELKNVSVEEYNKKLERAKRLFKSKASASVNNATIATLALTANSGTVEPAFNGKTAADETVAVAKKVVEEIFGKK